MSTLKIFFSLNILVVAVSANTFAGYVDPDASENLNEGSSLVFKFISTGKEALCSIVAPGPGSSADSSDFSLNAEDDTAFPINVASSFQFGFDGFRTATVTVSAIPTNDNQDETLYVQLQCGLVTLEKQIFIKEAGIQGDPHFKQLVTDIATGEKKQICYDVTGQSGQYIDILSEKSTHLDVTAQLLDDYYMHKIFVSYPHKNFTFTESGLMFNGVQTMLWSEKDTEIMHFGYVTVMKSTNSVRIVNSNDPKYIVKVLRKINNLRMKHLDVIISGLGDINANLGGLMGIVNNNLFEFKEQIQESSKIQFDVRNNRRLGRKVVRNDNKCILVTVEDAIFPHPKGNFIRN